MGDPSDIEELIPKALRDARVKWWRRLLWAVATSLGTIISATWAVSWKMNDYVHKAERRDEELRGEIRVIAKQAESAEKAAEEALKESRGSAREASDAKAQADKAMLYAQLTTKKERQ